MIKVKDIIEQNKSKLWC